MRGQRFTYEEGGKYYAVITTREGWDYYVGPFASRSTAYRKAKKHPSQGRQHGPYPWKV